MNRAERLARMLAPLRVTARPFPPKPLAKDGPAPFTPLFGAPKPRVVLRSVVMSADDWETPTDRLTLCLRAEERALVLVDWDEKCPAGAPHYWRDYECYDFNPPAESVPARVAPSAPGAVVQVEAPTPRGFVARLLDMIGVHA